MQNVPGNFADHRRAEIATDRVPAFANLKCARKYGSRKGVVRDFAQESVAAQT
nr:hypothetical protein [Bradyrhizobium ivorense]